MSQTYFWMGVFTVSGILFWGIAFWVIIRGGRDVFEMLTEARSNRKNGINK
jgi:hypothetical protein